MSLTEPTRKLPLPLEDLLESLARKGLRVGIAERLTIAKLLTGSDIAERRDLRGALAAILARNARERDLVGETFDHLYPETEGDSSSTVLESPDVPAPGAERGAGRPGLLRPWILIAICLAGAALTFYFLGMWQPAELVQPANTPVAGPVRPAPDGSASNLAVVDRLVTVRLLNWKKALGIAVFAAALVLVPTFRRRTGQAAFRNLRLSWIGELDNLPTPSAYPLKLQLDPLFPPRVLDQVAALLGRSDEKLEARTELDIEASLEDTLAAGMAPHLVWEQRRRGRPLLVLEDVASEMGPWRHRVSELVGNLRTRGVYLEHWSFDADAARLFRPAGPATTTLHQLAHRHYDFALVVISCGQGLKRIDDPRRAAEWTGLLSSWPLRAWLHPSADRRLWRPEMTEVAAIAWPLCASGLLAAARQLAHGPTGLALAGLQPADERPVAPLDVERLGWLVSLAPRQDPELAEGLRQRFCPHVPVAALPASLQVAESALATPARDSELPHPGVGPAAEDVHGYLAEILAQSEPLPGTLAHERWQLDLALTRLRTGDKEQRDAARRSLYRLAKGMVVAAEEMTRRRSFDRRARKELEKTLFDRARQESPGWTLPRLSQLAAAAACAALALTAASHLDLITDEASALGQEVYNLAILDQAPAPRLLLEKRSAALATEAAPAKVELVASDHPDGPGKGVRTVDLLDGSTEIPIDDLPRPSWYWVRSRRPDGSVALSNQISIAPVATATSLVTPIQLVRGTLETPGGESFQFASEAGSMLYLTESTKDERYSYVLASTSENSPAQTTPRITVHSFRLENQSQSVVETGLTSIDPASAKYVDDNARGSGASLQVSSVATLTSRPSGLCCVTCSTFTVCGAYVSTSCGSCGLGQLNDTRNLP